ncbi:MAG: hypothetical protein ACI4XJ_04040 [Eubacteriales bacterium]
MFKRIKREIDFIGDNIPVIILGVFICCIGGIFLWVSGDSNWYYAKSMHMDGVMPLEIVFVIWLLIYALSGFVLAMSCLADRVCCSGRFLGLRCAFIGGFGYLMMLLWYVLLFCTRLAFFGIILLILSIIAFGIIFVVIRRTFLLLNLAIILIEIVQIYFLCFSFLLYLLI